MQHISNSSVMSVLLLSVLCLLGATSFVNIAEYNLLPTNLIFELLLVISVISLFPHYKFSITSLFIFLVCVCYFLWQFYVFKANPSFGRLSDFLLIHKVYIYLALLVCLGRSSVLSNNTIIYFYRLLLGLMFFKYFISQVLGINARPGVFTENNFEVMLLLFSFLAYIRIQGRFSFFDILMVSLVTVLSGSRSGILGLTCLYLFLDLRQYGISAFTKFISTLILFGLTVLVFILRLEDMSVEDIDRIQFLFAFIDETSDWGWHLWLFGSPAITELSAEAVKFFWYYETLFSNYDSGIGFSVLFHSFILRMLFDHGVFGLAFVFFSVYWVTSRSAMSRNEVLSVVGILFVNALSVSSLNSVYAVWGIVMIICASLNQQVEQLEQNPSS